METQQHQLISKYFDSIGCSLDYITAIDSDTHIIFIILIKENSKVNLKPKFPIDEVGVFFTNLRIKFYKTIANGRQEEKTA
jgi:hypothetical protein